MLTKTVLKIDPAKVPSLSTEDLLNLMHSQGQGERYLDVDAWRVVREELSRRRDQVLQELGAVEREVECHDWAVGRYPQGDIIKADAA